MCCLGCGHHVLEGIAGCVGSHLPPAQARRLITSRLTLSLHFASRFLGPNWPHRRGTPASCTPKHHTEQAVSPFGSIRGPSVDRYEQNRGDKVWGGRAGNGPPRERGGCVGIGIVPQFPHLRQGQGAVPTCGHQGAVRHHVAPVPRCVAPPPAAPRCEAPPYIGS